MTIDLVVLGGGPAGSAAALTAKRAGVLRVLLVEGTRYEGPRVGESLAPDAARLVGALGFLPSFRADGHDVCHGSASAWGSDTLGYNDFLLNPHGPGHHLDRSKFDASLAAHASRAGVEVRTGTRFLRDETHDAAFLLHLDAGTVEARFVIDATGPGAPFARARGTTRREIDRLVCLTDAWSRTDDPGAYTLLEAVPYGWWYAARVPGGLVTMLATDPETLGERGLTDTGHRFTAARSTLHLARHLRCVGEHRWSQVHVATSYVRDMVAGPRWCAAGDAAAAQDPLSAAGLYHALRTGIAAGERAARVLAGEADDGSAYRALIHDRFALFLEHRRHLYALESRWPDEGFWRRRRTTG